jgi:hypothetical protein
MEKYTVEVDEEGTIRWYKLGTNKLHRTDGPAVEYANGDKYWYIEGECHRTDGPAIDRINGYKAWFIEGKHHRTDGPAIEFTDGYKAWYIEGECYTEQDFNKKVLQPSCDGKTVEIDGKTYKLTEVNA